MQGRPGRPALVAKLRAVARGRLGDVDGAVAALELLAPDVLPTLPPRQLALTTWSLARLEADGLATASEDVLSRASEFDVHELSMMLWAFASGPDKRSPWCHKVDADRPDRKEVAKQLMDEALRKLAEASMANLGNLLWASATLNGINLVEVAERAAVRMCEPAFLEASPQGVANMAWALVFASPSGMHQALTRAAEVAELRTPEFRPRDLAALGWALAVAAQAELVPELWLRVAHASLEAALEAPHGRNSGKLLAQTAWACASIRTSSEPLWNRLAAGLAHCAGDSLSSQDVANGIWALSTMSCQPSSLEALVAVAQGRIQSFEPRQLAACAWALATTRYHSSSWLEALASAAAVATSPGALPLLGASAWALASCDKPELLQALLPTIAPLLKCADSPSHEAMLQLAWSISLSGLSTSQRPLLDNIEELLRLEGKLRDGTRSDKVNPLQIPEVHQCFTKVLAMAELPRIVFQDKDLVILYKPIHWEVDDGITGKLSSGRRPLPLSAFMQQRFPNRPILHDTSLGCGFQGRLDVQSSGLVMCALTYEAFFLLQFRQDTHDVAREYLVLCHGLVPQELNEIRAPLWSKESSSRVDFVRGAAAKTLLQPIAWFRRDGSENEHYSLLVISIVTGRKHQIRCHLAHVGHPVVCDGRYAAEELFKDVTWCPRNFLHRFRIELPGIASREKVEACDSLPRDLQQVLGQLDRKSVV